MRTVTSWLKINRSLTSLVAITAISCALFAFAKGPLKTTAASSKTGSSPLTPKEAAAGCAASAVFTAAFVQGAEASDQVKQQWVDFRQSLVPANYDTVTIKGTFDSVGLTIHDSMVVPQIATTLQNSGDASWTVSGVTFNVGHSGSSNIENPGTEINANTTGDTATNSCPNPGWVVRPNLGNSSWGGANTETCVARSQTLEVIFSNSTTPCCAPAPAGMLAWWKGEGDATDSQDDHNATNSGATFSAGKVGQAFTFNGDGAYVRIPPSNDWNFGFGDFTVDFWEKSSSSDIMASLSFEPDPTFNSNNLDFYFNDVVGLWAFWNGGGANGIQVGSPGQYTDGQWHHVALTRSGDTFTLYIDGVSVGTFSYSGAINLSGGNDNYIGANYNEGLTHFWNGQIDEVEVFNSAATAEQIANIYAAGSVGKCPCTPAPDGMISWWKAEGDAVDSQDGHDGTLHGLVAFAPGEVGRAFSFEQSEAASYVDVGSVNLTDAFTIDAWINPTDFSSQPMIINKDDGESRSYYFELGSNGELSLEVISSAGDTHYLSAAGTVTLGTWQHVAATYNGSGETHDKIHFYVNGSPVPATTFSTDDGGTPNATSLTTKIGINGDGVNYAYTGLIDELELFSRVLTDAEIFSLYNAGGAGKCRSCTSAPGGMVSWWKAEGNTDDSADSNDGTFVGTPTYATGEVGQAFSFDGSNYVSVPDASNLHFSTEMTLDAWIYPTDMTNPAVMLTKIHENQNTFGYEFDYFPTGFLRFYISSDGSTYDSRDSAAGVITPNQWQHVAVTFNNGSVHFYVNGVDVGSDNFSSSSIFPGTNDLLIGSNAANAPVVGLMDEVEAIGRALNQGEIQKIFDAGSQGKCPCTPPPSTTESGGMVSWWRAEGDATDSNDSNDGTVNGGTTFTTGEVGQAFNFDGSTGYVSVPHNANQDIESAITIDAWIMKKGDCTNNCIVVMKQVSDGTCCDNLRYGILIIEPTHQIDFALNNGSWTDVVLSNTAIQNDAWYHIAGTYDSNQGIAKVYINGVLDNSTAINGLILPSTSGNLYIGRDSTQNSEFFNGLIDETELFNRALTDDEVAAIYHAGGAGKCVPSLTPTPTPTPTPTATPTVTPTPTATITPTVTPPVVGTEVNGHGTIAVEGGQASFDFSAQTPLKSGPHFIFYQDEINNFSFSTTNIKFITFNGNHVQFTGKAKVGKKKKITFTVDAYDNGPNGAGDQFFINASNGYSAGGFLTSGDIAISSH